MVADDPESFADLDGHTYRQAYTVANPAASSAWDPGGIVGSMTNDSGLTDEEVNSLNGFRAAQAAQRQAQNLKGPYVADLKNPEIAPLLDQNHKSSDADYIGPNHECVDLTKKFSGMLKEDKDMGTYRWRPGPKVLDDKDIKPGTAIANFNDKGRFPNKHTYNSGIYLNSGTKGSIWILDQWPGHPPRVREVLLDNRKEPADNAAAYSVIYVTPR